MGKNKISLWCSLDIPVLFFILFPLELLRGNKLHRKCWESQPIFLFFLFLWFIFLKLLSLLDKRSHHDAAILLSPFLCSGSSFLRLEPFDFDSSHLVHFNQLQSEKNICPNYLPDMQERCISLNDVRSVNEVSWALRSHARAHTPTCISSSLDIFRQLDKCANARKSIVIGSWKRRLDPKMSKNIFKMFPKMSNAFSFTSSCT